MKKKNKCINNYILVNTLILINATSDKSEYINFIVIGNPID